MQQPVDALSKIRSGNRALVVVVDPADRHSAWSSPDRRFDTACVSVSEAPDAGWIRAIRATSSRWAAVGELLQDAGAEYLAIAIVRGDVEIHAETLEELLDLAVDLDLTLSQPALDGRAHGLRLLDTLDLAAPVIAGRVIDRLLPSLMLGLTTGDGLGSLWPRLLECAVAEIGVGARSVRREDACSAADVRRVVNTYPWLFPESFRRSPLDRVRTFAGRPVRYRVHPSTIVARA